MVDTPMTRADLGHYLADCRELAIEEIRRFIPNRSPMPPNLYDLMLEYPLREAKGLRPALCLATCRALGGAAQAALTSAAVIELYHNAFLVHDDIEDGSIRRRDRPTLHRMHGVPIAINVGDGMLALALEPLLENTRVVGLGRALRILELVGRMSRETVEGQAIELDWIRQGNWQLTDDDYRQMVVKKTSWYSFIAPITMGAIAAGAADDQIATLQDFAQALGIAFQIRDDVLNLGGDEKRYGKELNGDLWEGKHTLILMHMIRSVPAQDRERACELLARPRPQLESPAPAFPALIAEMEGDGDITARGRRRLEAALVVSPSASATPKSPGDVAYLRELITSARSLEYADRIGMQHADRARRLLEEAPWIASSVHRDFLSSLIQFTIGRDH